MRISLRRSSLRTAKRSLGIETFGWATSEGVSLGVLKCYPARAIRKGEDNMGSKLAMGSLILGAIWGAYRRLRRPIPLQGSYAHAPTKILIIGGGFGGLSVARELARALRGIEDVGVALVDRLNYTTFWPMVPSVIPSNAEGTYTDSYGKTSGARLA